MNPLLPLVLLGTLLAVNSGKWTLLASPVIFFSFFLCSPFFKRGTDKHGAADMFKQLCCSVKCQRDRFAPRVRLFLVRFPGFFLSAFPHLAVTVERQLFTFGPLVTLVTGDFQQ